MAYIILETCLNCGACAFDCPAEAIHPSDAQYEVEPNQCVDCGKCHDFCPHILPDPAHPAKVTPLLGERRASIDAAKCIGCGLCAKVCPLGAPKGTLRSPFVIDEALCIGCGVCFDRCRKDALHWVETGLPPRAPNGEKASIDPETCIGCGLCAKLCPVSAISGQTKSPHTVDRDACIACGICVSRCERNAIHLTI